MESSIRRAFACADAANGNSTSEVIIVTHEKYLPLFSRRLSLSAQEKKRLRIIAEPAARNTAPAIALAVRYAQEHFGKHFGEHRSAKSSYNAAEAMLLIITADHLIGPTEAFCADAQKAARFARTDGGRIVTFGIVPTRPDTGFGYIECASKKENSTEGFSVASFREKPDAKTAEAYLAKKTFLWNSGMFCASAATMRAALETWAPDIASDIFSHVSGAFWKRGTAGGYPYAAVRGIDYAAVRKESIDYAVMEKARNVGVVPASFSWSDVGSWDEVAAVQESSPARVVEGKNVSVFSDMEVAVCGLSDIVVVSENGKILVMKKGCGQLVKRVAEDSAGAQP